MSGSYPDEEEPADLPVSTPLTLAKALFDRRPDYVRRRTIKVKIGTWNVAGCPGTDKDLASWFLQDDAPEVKGLEKLSISSTAPDGETAPQASKGRTDIGLYVLGLQEVIDLNMTKEYMNRTINPDLTPTEKWKTALEAAMPEGYQLVATDQMVGLLLFIYASPEVSANLSNISTKQVGTGLLGYFGNKGAIATRIVLGETTRLVFVNCHLASGSTATYLDRRYWDVSQVLTKTIFDPIIHMGRIEEDGEKIGDEDFAFWFGDLNFRLDGLPGDDIRRILTLHTRGEYDVHSSKASGAFEDEGVIVTKTPDDDDAATTTTTTTTTASSIHSREQSFDTITSLPDPDDFPEDPSQDPASLQATIDSLLPHDQLKRSMRDKKVFHDGWREGLITFLPSYKYDVGSVTLFDSSEKQRAPSWCDRILFRTKLDRQQHEKKAAEELEAKKKDDEMKSRGLEEDDDVLFTYDPENDGDDTPAEAADEPLAAYEPYDEDESGEPVEFEAEEDTDRIAQTQYMSYQRITSSDHKPIVSFFTLDYDCVIPELKTQVYAEVARELDRAENERRPVITIVNEGDESVVDLGEMGFLQKNSTTLTVANTGSVAATLAFVDKPSLVDDVAAGSSWLSSSLTHNDDVDEVSYKEVTLQPGETADVTISGQVTSIPLLRALNDGHQSLDDVLILRVEGGRDHFLGVRATWRATCFGRSIDELIRVPDGGIRQFIQDKQIKGAIPYDFAVHCSAPRELFKLTEAIQTLSERCVADAAMLEEFEMSDEPGWPFDSKTWTAKLKDQDSLTAVIIDAMDRDASITEALPVELPSSHRLELLAATLLLFLSSFTDGLVPAQLSAKMATTIPNVSSLAASALPDMKFRILDIMSSVPSHNIAFVFLTTTLARVATELVPVTKKEDGLQRRLSFKKADDGDGARRRRARQKRYAEVLAPDVFRDKTVGDKEKAILELFLRTDVDG
ncbi:hypothetical protein VHEMI08539 [[Torrubiella] hemipterigena]|uniref:Inositol polyphosphate-related phosphatase domain-containing protein n=1 Tax=[Torrubiella] hemipterigena TaxID=1531966 RepID=A0A0A1TPV8_9HYPO|nr:hypothetical protein VHEMI08539 [[Torrubiella] hemipterigena]